MNRPCRTSLRIACVAMSVFPVLLPGAHADAALVAVGAGEETCAQMYAQSGERSDDRRKVGASYLNWFEGFLSGMNVANVAHVSRREPLDIEARNLRELVVQYCDEEPQADLLTVAVKIYYERDGSPAE